MNITIERRREGAWREEGQGSLLNFLDAHGFDVGCRLDIHTEMTLSGRYEDAQWRLRKVAA